MTNILYDDVRGGSGSFSTSRMFNQNNSVGVSIKHRRMSDGAVPVARSIATIH
ncbi:MAG TPA: hypothetical protein VJH33_03835 [Candidatus Paceibacterota bacterium]